jgi:hypothetical protein
MVEDIEACKKFLIQKNNEGLLNIDLLAVIADREMTINAVSWTLRDWSYAPVAGRKQGQDVKAMILINPVRNFNGINANDVFRAGLFTGAVGAGFPILVAGEGSDAREARNIYDAWKRDRRGLGSATSYHLEYSPFQTEKQVRVVKVAGEADKMLAVVVGEFLQKEVFDRKHDFRWQDRSSQ